MALPTSVTSTLVPPGQFDEMTADDVFACVYSAVAAGLMDMTLPDFEEELRLADDKEAFLQELWDRL
jgi:hypothetical protein